MPRVGLIAAHMFNADEIAGGEICRNRRLLLDSASQGATRRLDSAGGGAKAHAGMSLFTLLRTVHLYSSLVLPTFVVMYFVTGYIMVHHSWFPDPTPFKSACTEPLSYAGPMDPEVYSSLPAADFQPEREAAASKTNGGRRVAVPLCPARNISRGCGDSRRRQRSHLQARRRCTHDPGRLSSPAWIRRRLALRHLGRVLRPGQPGTHPFPPHRYLSVVSTDQAPPSRMDTPGAPCCI